MVYMCVKVEDLLNSVITQEEWDFVSNLRIPVSDLTGLWLKKQIIDQKVTQAIESGAVVCVVSESATKQSATNIISDYTGGGIDGIQSMADGKYYDSKSQYRKELKRRGLVELGNDAPREAKPMEANICERDLKRDIAQAIQQLGG